MKYFTQLFHGHSAKFFISIGLISFLLAVLVFEACAKTVFAEESVSVFYVPLIGITSVPDPLVLPKGPGNVTYNYAVKNFLREAPLTDVRVVDASCGNVKYHDGDDNHDNKLDYSETWRYTCTTKLTETTQSTATATGTANNLSASHKAYTTVVVGADLTPPLVSIVNITKVAYPLSLPVGGGSIAFTYKVNNPGIVPLSNVTVSDDKCKNMSGQLGDTNGNSLLDVHEVWVYTCETTLQETTTNTVNVAAYANGLKANDSATITVKVATTVSAAAPIFPATGLPSSLTMTAWIILTGVLAALLLFFVITRRKGKARA